MAEAAKHSSRVLVGIGSDGARKYVLPPLLRVALAQEAIQCSGLQTSGLEVVGVSGEATIADLVVQYQCGAVFRGSRGPQDLEVEARRRRVAADLLPGLGERWFIWQPEDPDLTEVSATRMRDAAFNGVFLPSTVCSYRAQAALRYYIRGEVVVAVLDEDGGEALAHSIVGWFQRRSDPCAMQMLQLGQLRADPPEWGWIDQETSLAAQVRSALGKARPSVRLLCARLPRDVAELEVLLRSCHGTVACESGFGFDVPLRQAVRERGGKYVPLQYGDDGSLNGVEGLLVQSEHA